MEALLKLVDQGGPVMYAIVALSVVLYTRCFRLLLNLRRLHSELKRDLSHLPNLLAALRRRQLELQESFRQQRFSLGAMVAAAPLLGLLGTVSGMVTTFESLASRDNQKSMEGLAGGISEVLIATESGLAVAIPALLIVYLAHREVNRQLQTLNRLETFHRAKLAA